MFGLVGAMMTILDQAAETGWLGPFKDQISQMWDITNVHINKNSMEGVKADLVSIGSIVEVVMFDADEM